MNVVYILGNGFDKAQGMATSYPEFYKYLDLEERSALIEQLKKEIKSDKEQWSDMEEAFGKFSSKIDTEDNFTKLYFDLNDLLQIYLKSEDEAFVPTENLKNKFREDFLTQLYTLLYQRFCIIRVCFFHDKITCNLLHKNSGKVSLSAVLAKY